MTRSLIAKTVLAVALLAPGAAAAQEVVDMVPSERASWGATDIFAPITGFFLGGPNYWYKAREITVETVPPGAALDLFYVRASFQKRYEQAEAPALVKLPSRVQAGKRDSLTIRALLPGYEQAEVHVRVRSRQEKVVIELQPLANSLTGVGHTHLAGRESLTLLTAESLNFRIQKTAAGFSLVLNETALGPGTARAIEELSSPFIRGLRPQQLGEDLIIQTELTEAASDDRVEVRSRQAFDAVRRIHSFSLDFVPRDGGADGIRRAKAAFARISSRDVAGCALVYEEALRSGLDPAQLSRALAPAGTFTDPYLREAMKRLGQVSPGGVVRLTDGTRFQVAAPIELMAAQSQSAEAVGYLALLRQFAANLEPVDRRRSTLKGLVAPELAAGRFAAIAEAAEQQERRCREGAAAGPAAGL